MPIAAPGESFAAGPLGFDSIQRCLLELGGQEFGSFGPADLGRYRIACREGASGNWLGKGMRRRVQELFDVVERCRNDQNPSRFDFRSTEGPLKNLRDSFNHIFRKQIPRERVANPPSCLCYGAGKIPVAVNEKRERAHAAGTSEKFIGSRNERELKKLNPIVAQINDLEPKMELLPTTN